VARAAKYVAQEYESPGLVGHQPDVSRHPGYHVRANTEVGEIESMWDIERSDLEHDRNAFLEANLMRRVLEALHGHGDHSLAATVRVGENRLHQREGADQKRR